MWTEQKIVELLKKSDVMVCRSIIRLYERQTEDERVARETSHHNGMGFNKLDARLLSAFAQQYNKHGFLSRRQTAIARRMLPKYRKQLVLEANRNGEKK